MSKETAKNLFIVSSMPRLYQALLTGVGSYEALGNRIVKQIKTAHAFRQVEQVRELATVLCNIPIREYQLIGQYYLVWCNCRESVFKAGALESLIGQTQTYKVQVLSSRAAIEVYQGKLEAALYFYSEALKASPAISEYISVRLGIATLKGREGFHQSALKDMENLVPILGYAEPRLYFDMLNSYATELGAVGRLDEARNVSRIVIASPFTFAYPEWRETAEDLKQARRSMVTVGQIHSNVLAMPEREHGEPSLQPKPARVLSYAKGKKKMDKKDKDEKIQKSIDEMNFKDLGFKLLELITTNQADEEQMRLIVAFAMSLFAEPSKPDPDKPAS
jgi:tetratricopeptide (TPR) repeat protein